MNINTYINKGLQLAENQPDLASASTIEAAALSCSVDDFNNSVLSCAFNFSAKSLSGIDFSIVLNTLSNCIINNTIKNLSNIYELRAKRIGNNLSLFNVS